MAGGPRAVARRIQENKNARELAVRQRRNKANLSSAPVGLYSESGKLGFMSPCKGEISNLTVKAEKETQVVLTADGFNVSFDIPEEGIYEDEGTFKVSRGDSVQAQVTKDNLPIEAFFSFLFKPLGKDASLVHFDQSTNSMISEPPGGPEEDA